VRTDDLLRGVAATPIINAASNTVRPRADPRAVAPHSGQGEPGGKIGEGSRRNGGKGCDGGEGGCGSRAVLRGQRTRGRCRRAVYEKPSGKRRHREHNGFHSERAMPMTMTVSIAPNREYLPSRSTAFPTDGTAEHWPTCGGDRAHSIAPAGIAMYGFAHAAPRSMAAESSGRALAY
jgi:hypothetical protein